MILTIVIRADFGSRDSLFVLCPPQTKISDQSMPILSFGITAIFLVVVQSYPCTDLPEAQRCFTFSIRSMLRIEVRWFLRFMVISSSSYITEA